MEVRLTHIAAMPGVKALAWMLVALMATGALAQNTAASTDGDASQPSEETQPESASTAAGTGLTAGTSQPTDPAKQAGTQPPATTETAQPKPPAQIVSDEAINEALAALPSVQADPSAADKRAALNAAQTFLIETRQWTSKNEAVKATIANADERIATFNEQRDTLDIPPIVFTTLKDGNARIEKLRGRLTELENRLRLLNDERRDVTTLRTNLAQRLSTIDQRLAELRKIDAKETAITYRNLAEAQRLAAEASYLRQIQSSFEKLSSVYRAENDFLQANISAYTEALDAAQERLKSIQSDVLTAEETEARATVERAKGIDPALETIANDILAIVLERRAALKAANRVASRLAEVEAQVAAIEAFREENDELIDLVGLSPPIAQQLMRKLESLPEAEELRRLRQSLAQEIRDVRLDLIDFDKRREAFLSVDEATREISERLEDGSSWLRARQLNREVRGFVTEKRDQFTQLVDETSSVFESQVRLDTALLELIAATESLNTYAEERLLWMPNRQRLEVVQVPGAIVALGETTLSFFQLALFQAPLNTLLRLLFVVALVAGMGFVARQVSPLRERKLSDARFVDTLIILIADLAWAISFGLGLLALTYPLSPDPVNRALQSEYFTVALDRFLIISALFFLLRLAMPTGIGIKHFRWVEGPCRRVRRSLYVFGIPTALIAFMHAVIVGNGVGDQSVDDARWIFVLGRLFILSSVIYAFNPQNGILAQLPEKSVYHKAWLRYPIFLFIGAYEVMLVVLSVFGYEYAGSRLVTEIQLTFILVLSLIMIHGLVLRYLRIARIRLHMRNRQEKKAQKEVPKTQPPFAEKEPEAAIQEIDTREFDAQSRRVLNTIIAAIAFIGLNFIWGDVVQALSGSIGESTALDLGDERSFTLSQLGSLLITIVLTMVFAANVPQVLDVLLLMRMHVASGNRYAIRSLLSYCFVFGGIYSCAEILNVQWSEIQWLVAGISVGLGFGMQEIFANFVSGIILLFERPIRVGDIVTIGETSGTVTRIRIRGTTITDWDRLELIVPNKEFISGRLINWTNSDTVTRIKIPVHVEYGSDVDEVQSLLQAVLSADPNVMTDPAPFVYLLSFGERGLQFTCYAYLATPDLRLRTTHSLCNAIHRKLTAEGYAIPFPQIQVHMDPSEETKQSDRAQAVD